MTIKFKIINVSTTENSIVVKYYDDVMTEEMVGDRTTFNLNLPIPTPTGDYLNEYIVKHAPASFFVTADAVINGNVDLSHIDSMVGSEFVAFNPAKEIARKRALIKYEKISFDPSTMHCLVKYYTDSNPDGITLNVGTPLVNGKYPSEEMLHKQIMDVAPINELDSLNVKVDPSIAITSSLDAIKVIRKDPTPEEIAAKVAKENKYKAVDAITVTTSSGKTFDGNEVSQDRMTRAIIGMKASNTQSMQWVLADNSIAQVTVDELSEAVALAVAKQTSLWVS